MKVKDSVALVTGANRGLGRALAQRLLEMGARKVYAAARDPSTVTLPGVVPVRLDVTDPEQVAAAAAACTDTNLLINNAGIGRAIGFLEPGSIAAARELLETNYFGPIRMSQAFAPLLAVRGGGAIINVLSVASWINPAHIAPYAASKSAAWGFTNGLRAQLRSQGTQVLGLHVGYMDTDMIRDFAVEKISPASVARQTLEGLEAGREEVLADEISRAVKQGLSAEPAIYLALPAI